MAKYTEVNSAYDHVEVISVKLNYDQKKAVGNGTYKASSILVQPADGSDPKSIKIAQNWLDIDYPTQNALREKLAVLKAGDKVTILRNKTVKDMEKEDYDALSKDEKKTTGNWGVKEILEGHVIPAGHERSSPASAAPRRGGGENVGMLTNHANNAAGNFMQAQGTKYSADAYNEIAIKMHQITLELKAEYGVTNPLGLDAFEIGNAVGGAVLNAAKLASSLDKVKALAADLLAKNVAVVREAVSPKKEAAKEEAPAEDKPAVKKSAAKKEAPSAEPAVIEDDEDLPF